MGVFGLMEYAAKGLKASKDAEWYQAKADEATTETEREWWLGFAHICRGEVEHYAEMSARYEKESA